MELPYQGIFVKNVEEHVIWHSTRLNKRRNFIFVSCLSRMTNFHKIQTNKISAGGIWPKDIREQTTKQ